MEIFSEECGQFAEDKQGALEQQSQNTVVNHPGKNKHYEE